VLGAHEGRDEPVPLLPPALFHRRQLGFQAGYLGRQLPFEVAAFGSAGAASPATDPEALWFRRLGYLLRQALRSGPGGLAGRGRLGLTGGPLCHRACVTWQRRRLPLRPAAAVGSGTRLARRLRDGNLGRTGSGHRRGLPYLLRAGPTGTHLDNPPEDLELRRRQPDKCAALADLLVNFHEIRVLASYLAKCVRQQVEKNAYLL